MAELSMGPQDSDVFLRQFCWKTRAFMNFQPLDITTNVKSFRPSSRIDYLFVVPFPELVLAALFLAAGKLLALSFDLNFVLPSGSALEFTGMSYGVPLSLIFMLGLFLILTKQTMRLLYYVTAALGYGIILITHFNIKMWMNLINPSLWDGFYWNTDQMVRPLIDASFEIHNFIGAIIPFGDHLYLFAFLAMFASSIIVHSVQCFIVFRKVIFTAMLVHVLGGLSYLVMPAVGPFMYENGVNALEAARQEHMYGGYRALMAGGRTWIASQGSQFMFAAVAAMPSLHVASSAVFVHYAWKHARWLGVLYLPLFAFIIFEAMATRWHYWIDVVAGLALTAFAIAIATAVFRPIEAYHTMRRQGREAPVSA